MNTFYFILLLIAALSFLVAASNVVSSRVNLLALGLFMWVLVPLIQTIKVL